MIVDIPPAMRTFFMPQVEQLGITEVACRHGYQGMLKEMWGTGFLWALNIDDNCLVCVHDVRLQQQRRLVEHPIAYACLCSTSAACVKDAPVEVPPHLRARENLLGFAQPDTPVEFDIEAGVPYTSTSICLTPEFFTQHPDLHVGGFEGFARLLDSVPVNAQPEALRGILRCLDPTLANTPGAALYYRAKVAEAVSVFVMDAQQGFRALQQQGERSQRVLVDTVKQLVLDNLHKPLSLDALAADLFVSRSALCAVFRQEVGTSLGAWIRTQRLARAQELLAGGAGVAETAHAVGYRRQGSFAEMFKRATGLTPTEWRAGI